MKLSKKEYAALVREKMPASPLWKDVGKAFVAGGLICCVGEIFRSSFLHWGLNTEDAGTWTTVVMVFLGALLTGLGVYDRLARHGGAGTLVPVTGFANSVAAPALEFKTEGMITGTAVKMFSIAGPVIVYGTLASVIYGIFLLLFS